MASKSSGLWNIFGTNGRRPKRGGKKLKLESLEERQLLSADLLGAFSAAHPWSNYMLSGDVNNDGVIAPIDALIVLNELNANGARSLTTPSQSASGPVAEGELEQPEEPVGTYYDVNRDSYVTPADALFIINQLNAEGAPSSVIFNPDALGSISGFFYNDVTGDGITPGTDVPVNGEGVRLFMDLNGNGGLDPGDVPTGGQSTLPFALSGHTGVDGEYRFEGLGEGTYFLRREAANQGFATYTGDPDTITVVLTAQQAAGVEVETIDDFSAGNLVTVLGDPYDTLVAPTALPITAGAGQEAPVGAERELAIRRTSPYGATSTTAFIALTDGNLSFSNSAGGWGDTWIAWDGTVDGGDATTLDPDGLGGIDITNGGAGDLFTITAGADRAGAIARVHVYDFDDQNNWSEFEMPIPLTSNLPNAPDVDVIYVRFTDFTVMGGTGADFANVGAIQLFIEDATHPDGTPFGGLDGRLRFVGTHGTVDSGGHNFRGYWPAAIGDRVWIDGDGNGTYNTGEGVNGVELRLWIDDNGNGVLDPAELGNPGLQIATTVTANDGSGNAGWYEFNSDPGINFDGAPGDYIVQVVSTNFGGGSPLDGYHPLSGTVTDPDNDVDDDNNGRWFGGVVNGPNGVVADAVTITSGGEPQAREIGIPPNNYQIAGAYNPTIDFGFTQAPPVQVGVGDRVWIDANNNGMYDTGEGVNGVNLALLRDANSNGVLDPAELAAPVATTQTTDSPTDEDGWYRFITDPGDYFVQVLGSNFATSAPLDDYAPIPMGAPTDPDDNVDHDSNGQWAADPTNGVVSKAVTLSVGGEPADLAGAAATGTYNPTVDFGFNRINLRIDKSDNPDPLFVGDTLTYTLVITNDGPMDATDVIVRDRLPDEVTYNPADNPLQYEYDTATHTVGVNLGSLAVGNSVTMTIVVTVTQQPAATDGLIWNHAEVTCNESDKYETDLTDNEDDEPTEILQVAPAPCSISGYVYVDMDNDGQKDSDDWTPFDGEGNEGGIAVCEIVLTGTTDTGVQVAMTTFTDEFGYYEFTDLMPGTYTVHEVQPEPFIDGKDTPGCNIGCVVQTPAPEPAPEGAPDGAADDGEGAPPCGVCQAGQQINMLAVIDDEFQQIALRAGVQGVNFNFGELIPSKREYIASNN